ncbi:hypothetical protein HOK51_11385 [Candidatus Woesearchaeota archaeon]|jgi:hypothetical protein|nr:hypothetical protein [Candidatus Woesearchaeota archaeon]MBT6520424.1 hypothetical protein [Candidatus Woesearchaeota archaeon]MBT7368830.1 hypothetical protein [Candidatus Woesearchaeota archaeon]
MNYMNKTYNSKTRKYLANTGYFLLDLFFGGYIEAIDMAAGKKHEPLTIFEKKVVGEFETL